ncbi:hypothetical protein L211DRAFT_846426 [Terfezia boudieri ATCC MYA-4762]|uniref:Rrn9 domain-containing protein n=1 Tax=Terfezia boudieri ATCC MYA-4762 TaxID=1051890 RepID=A0A3N4LXQ3_9PEZI|nr:hypothetical protein L211DRAFT_846426 [Terfezia boudieri ATCC MYA-4762]
MRPISGGGSEARNDTLTQAPADRRTPESLPSDGDSDFGAVDGRDDIHDALEHQSDSTLHFPSPSPTRSLSSRESDSESSSRHAKRKRKHSIPLRTQHLESTHTIQQHKNLLKSIETEFASNLTGHIWSAILIQREQREKEERKRNGLSVDPTREDSDDSDAPPPPKRRRGRPRLSGPDYTMQKLVTKAWTSWPLPYGELPPIPPSTTMASTTASEPPPHPLEEAITALFLCQSAKTLRSRNLPISADDIVSTHMLKPVVGGILAKLDRLLLAVYESTNADMRGESAKVAKGRILRRVPMGWSGVLGLAGLAGWDEGWGGVEAMGKSKHYASTGVGSPLGPVGRATERMCNALGEKMNWRVWPEHISSLPISFPIQCQLDTNDRSNSPILQPCPERSTSHHKLRNGAHNDGFLELIPTKAERKERRRRDMKKEREKVLVLQDGTVNKHADEDGMTVDDESQSEASEDSASETDYGESLPNSSETDDSDFDDG